MDLGPHKVCDGSSAPCSASVDCRRYEIVLIYGALMLASLLTWIDHCFRIAWSLQSTMFWMNMFGCGVRLTRHASSDVWPVLQRGCIPNRTPQTTAGGEVCALAAGRPVGTCATVLVEIHQRGVQWKQGVVFYIIL